MSIRMTSDPKDAASSGIQEASMPAPVHASDEITQSMSGSKDSKVSDSVRDSSFDLPIKDAYLVFRALCKLSMKSLPSEGY